MAGLGLSEPLVELGDTFTNHERQLVAMDAALEGNVRKELLDALLPLYRDDVRAHSVWGQEGTLFGIDPTTYSFWKEAGSSPLTVEMIERPRHQANPPRNPYAPATRLDGRRAK